MPSIEKVLAFIGAVVVLLKLLKLLIDLSPKLQAFLSKAYIRLYDGLRIRQFKKLAISENIQAQVNEAVGTIREELPSNWIRRVSVKWMRSTQPSYIKDNEIILRMRPDENPDRTFLLALHAYLDNSIFPSVKEIVPENVRGAVLLSLMQKVVRSKYSAIRDLFDTEIFQPSIRTKAEVAGHYGDIESLEEIGFFTSIYVREIEKASELLRFSHDRDNFETLIKDLSIHLKKFRILQPELMPIHESDWRYMTKYFSHAIILVAHPQKAKNDELDAYYNRIRRALDLGIRTVYILGSAAEKAFVQSVITRSMDVSGYKMDFLFRLSNDYRRKKGGVCAIFIKDQYATPEPQLLTPAEAEAKDRTPAKVVENIGDRLVLQPQEDVASLTTAEIKVDGTGAVGNGEAFTRFPSAAAPQMAGKTELIKYIVKYVLLGSSWGEAVTITRIGKALIRKFKGRLDYGSMGYTGLLALIKDIPDLEVIQHGNSSGSIKIVRRIHPVQTPSAISPQPIVGISDLERLVLQIIDTRKDESGFVFLGALGANLKNIDPNFAPKAHGYDTLIGLIRSLQLVKIEQRERGGSFHAYVGRK